MELRGFLKSRYLFLLALCFSFTVLSTFCSLDVFAYAPSKTDCKQWDDRYLGMFSIAVGAALVIPTVTYTIFLGLAGRFWVFASSSGRYVSTFVFSVFITALSSYIGTALLQKGIVGEINYLDCANVPFGAEGLFGGLLGANIAFIGQIPNIIAALCITSILGNGIIDSIVFALGKFRGSYAQVRERQI